MAGVINYAGMMKSEATSHYAIYGEFPHSGGYTKRKMINGDFVSAIEHWAPDPENYTEIHVYVQPDLFPGASLKHALIMRGDVNDGHITWNCLPHESFRAIEYKYLPGECVD